MQDPGKRKISAGTIVMLTLTVLVLIGTGFVLIRLSSGKSVDLSKLQLSALELKEKSGNSGEEVSAGVPETTEKPSSAPESQKPAGETKAPESIERVFTLTAAGTVSLDGEVRKNSYFSDVKQYDYYDTMMLLKKELTTDLNVVFLENLLTEEGKVNDVTAAASGAAMLKAAGFNAAACGFAKAYDQAETGIQTTRKILTEQGILPVGIYTSTGEEHFRIQEINGIRTVLLQYTDTVAAKTRSSMEQKEVSGLVPDAEAENISMEIAQARAHGAEVVIVLLNWGKSGKAPDSAMRTLAQAVADAGADLIIGNGSRIVSGAEYLTVQDTGRKVLCVWSLGTVLSGNRNNIKWIAGMMLQATIRVENGKTEIQDIGYIPLYTWKYKQDGRFNYRCLAADGAFPDGMDAEQQKLMTKAAETVQNAMKGSPVEVRSR